MHLTKVLFFLSLLCFPMMGELRLSEVWPQAMTQGRYDDLGLKFTVGQRLTIMPSSLWCLVDGQPFKLTEPAKALAHGDWILPESLVSKLGLEKPKMIAPGLGLSSWAQRPVIVIDPGHGGKDPGAIGMGGLMEKDVVLDVSKRVVARLRRENVVVHMTRQDDRFIGLHERGEMSNRWRATVFVSIHCNSHGKRELEGYQLYRQSENVSFKARADIVRSKFPLPQYTPIPKTQDHLSFNSHEELFRWKDKESTILSRNIHQEMQYRKSKVTTQPKKNLCVLRETMAPSILVETDFVSNPKVELQMNMSQWREKMAEDIVRGILSYLGMGPQS
jgi:N-acetylmuramoyl-L-alanine amidase